MAKPFRGSSVRYIANRPGRGRGICPICKRTGVKLLWQSTLADGNQDYVCKRCQHVKL